MLEGKPGASRDVAYSEWHVNASRCGVALKLHTVRTETAKLTVERESGVGELYNLAEDPYEMDNRFDDPGCRALQNELEGMIKDRPGEELTSFDAPVGMA